MGAQPALGQELRDTYNISHIVRRRCGQHAQPGKCPGYPEKWEGIKREWTTGYIREKGNEGKGRKGGLNLVASVRDSNIMKEDVLGSSAC